MNISGIYLLKTIETINGCPSIAILVDTSLGKSDIISLSNKVIFLLYSLKKQTKKSPIISINFKIIKYIYIFYIFKYYCSCLLMIFIIDYYQKY